MTDKPYSITNAVESLFSTTKEPLSFKQKSRKKGLQPSQDDLKLALTVLLVELAASDQSFDPSEYNIIANGLLSVFGAGRTEIQSLVNRANVLLANFSGTTRFADLLKNNLSEEARRSVMQVVEEVIMADGVEDGYETYLRHKFAKLLDVPLPQDKGQPE